MSRDATGLNLIRLKRVRSRWLLQQLGGGCVGLNGPLSSGKDGGLGLIPGGLKLTILLVSLIEQMYRSFLGEQSPRTEVGRGISN